MFDRVCYVLPGANEDSSVFRRDIRAVNELANELKKIHEEESKTKDRVDISLSEYERIKRENRDLAWKVSRLEAILSSIRIPVEKYEQIQPDSVKVESCSDPIHFKQRIRIEFDISDI